MRGMRSILAGIVVMLLAAGCAFAEVDISGRWLLEGTGHAEKGVLKVELTDEGYLDVNTETRDGVQYLTGYDVRVTLNASRLSINAWEYRDSVTLQTPIEIPELGSTTDQRLELPAVTVDGMTYEVTFITKSSDKVEGTVKIYGDLDVDTVGTVEITSESAIWKEGTEKPDIPDMSSGCNAIGFPAVLLTMFPLFGWRKHRS